MKSGLSWQFTFSGREPGSLRFVGLLGFPGKLFGELEGVHGVFVGLLAEFVSGQVISLAVSDGSGGVGVGRKVMEFCNSIVRALGHGVLLGLQILNHGRDLPCAKATKIPRFTRDDN